MNFSSMLCLALANAEGFMSSWKAQDQEVPATNDLMEIEDLTLTAPSPLQRLLSSDDDKEQEEEEENQTDENGEEEDEEDEEEDEDDDGIDKWSTPQVAGVGVLGGLVLGGFGAVAAGKMWKSSPEKRLAIVIEVSIDGLTDDQKKNLTEDPKVEYAEGTSIISTYKTAEAFTAAHEGITVASSKEQDKGTWVKCGETFYESTADNTWKPQETGPVKGTEGTDLEIVKKISENVDDENNNQAPVEETNADKIKAAQAEKEADKIKAAQAEKEKGKAPVTEQTVPVQGSSEPGPVDGL